MHDACALLQRSPRHISGQTPASSTYCRALHGIRAKRRAGQQTTTSKARGAVPSAGGGFMILAAVMTGQQIAGQTLTPSRVLRGPTRA
jgi:hypothetical protein